MHPRSKLSITRFFKYQLMYARFMANREYTIGSIQETIKKELIRTKQIPNNETTAIFLFLQQKLLKASDGNSSFTQCFGIYRIEGTQRIIFCTCS